VRGSQLWRWASEFRIKAVSGELNGRTQVQAANVWLLEPVGPLMGLAILDKMLLGGKKEYSDQDKALLGSQGLWQWAPGASAIDFATGKTFKVPALDLATTLGDLVYNNRNGGINNSMEKAFRSYTPGVAWARFMFEDVPALMGEERARGEPKALSEPFKKEPEQKLKQTNPLDILKTKKQYDPLDSIRKLQRKTLKDSMTGKE
jgi:hypothetical protein